MTKEKIPTMMAMIDNLAASVKVLTEISEGRHKLIGELMKKSDEHTELINAQGKCVELLIKGIKNINEQLKIMQAERRTDA